RAVKIRKRLGTADRKTVTQLIDDFTPAIAKAAGVESSRVKVRYFKNGEALRAAVRKREPDNPMVHLPDHLATAYTQMETGELWVRLDLTLAEQALLLPHELFHVMQTRRVNTTLPLSRDPNLARLAVFEGHAQNGAAEFLSDWASVLSGPDRT